MLAEIETPALPGPAAAPAPQARTRRWLRPKGGLSPNSLTIVMLLIGATVLTVLARLIAMPDTPVSGWSLFDPVRHFGALLNDTLTLEWIPLADRHAVNYLLMLPTAVLLITIVRLTLGLRVLGFRSIVIAAGFQEIGVLPSVIVIAAVLAIIGLLRPAMRRIGLPLFARISLIMGITACTMVATLFIGPWLRSELIWSLAFFPVIIVAMMAESIAGSLDRGGIVSAAWRLGWTLVVALLLLVLLNSPAALEIALRFPELMLTQLMAIILVADYLDLRLLEGWPGDPDAVEAAVARWLGNAPAALRRQPRVAVVRNRWNRGVIAHLGQAAPASGRVNSVQHMVDALRDQGYEVKVFEGDMTLLRELQSFLAPHPRTGAPGGVVLNLAAGIQGRGRFGHVPAMLEMAGVAYTGPDPIAHARVHDRFALLSSLQQAGVPVPAFRLVAGGPQGCSDVALPVLVSPRSEPDAAGTLVRTAQEFDAVVEKLSARHGQEVLVEAWLGGAEFRVALLGNSDLECLPLMRVDAASQERQCPATIDAARADRIRECARRAYRAAGCRDYARIDLRLGATGEPCVVHVQSQEILARNGSFAAMAAASGLSWPDLARRFVEAAAVRTGAEVAARPLSADVVPLARSAAAVASDTRDAGQSAASAT